MYDTATRIIRTKNTASDKDLDIVEETNLAEMVRKIPACQAILTAGQLATTIACRQFHMEEPQVGDYTEFEFDHRRMRLYRMPSSSRAYPMAVERKAEAYQKVFNFLFKKECIL